MSRPAWNGAVVHRPSGWRNCLWEPRCRTSVKTVGGEQDDDLPRPEDGQVAHESGNLDCSDVDELRFERRLAVLQ